ncbi:hypothetical protein ACLOJK_017085 [Asimina triloba]
MGYSYASIANGKGKIHIADLVYIRQYYGISMEVGLITVNLGDTPQSFKPGCLCINESTQFVFPKLVGSCDIGREWGVPTTWDVDLEKFPVATSAQKGQEVTFKAMTSFFKERNLKSTQPILVGMCPCLKPVIKGLMKVKPLEGKVVTIRFALMLEKAMELEIRERDRMGVVSKRPLTPIKEEVSLITTEELAKKRRRQLIKGFEFRRLAVVSAIPDLEKELFPISVKRRMVGAEVKMRLSTLVIVVAVVKTSITTTVGAPITMALGRAIVTSVKGTAPTGDVVREDIIKLTNVTWGSETKLPGKLIVSDALDKCGHLNLYKQVRNLADL